LSQTVKLRRSATSGSVPTTSALALGELAINTYDGKLYLKKSVSGTESIVEIGANNLADTFHVYEYSVTANTTVFQGSDDNSHTLSYTTGSPPRLAVYLNGLLLDWGTDFTATNGTSVTLSSAAVSGDLIQIQAYKSTVVAGSNLMFGDNVKAQFGDDGDLEIYHDGSNSIINDIGTGNLQFQIGGSLIYSTTTDGIVLNDGLDVEANEFIGDLRGAILFKAQAGEALSKGDAVYISGISGNTTIVSKADADDANKMPAFGVAATAITSGTTGDIYTFGTLSGIDTSSFSEGDELYVSTTAGALTNSAPTGSSAQIQKIAKVSRSHNSSGSIKIMGAGRSNATPNLDEGKIFVGNASNQSVQVDSTITVDMANSQVLVDGALSVEGGSFTSGLETATDIGIVIQKGDYIYSDDNNYLRKIIGHTAANHIEIGQTGTALIGDINIRPGSTGNIKLFGSGSEDFKVDSSGNTTMNGTATINNAVTGDASQFTIVNGAGATLRMGITGSGANEAAHIKTNAGEALEFHIGQASNVTTPDIEFLADGAGIDFQGVNILNSSRNMTTNSRFTFDYNDHYLEAGTNSLALKNSGGTSYFVASNTGLSVTGALSSTGDLTVGGNLTVNGTTTTLNTATLTVDDLNITVADGAANAAAANGAGLTVAGAGANFVYQSTNDRWTLNKEVFTAHGFMIGTTATDVGLIKNSSGVFDFQAQSAREISFSNVTNGEHVRIDADGNVGIGTTDPTTKLHLSGDSVNLSLDGTGAAGTPITSISLSRGSVNWGIHSGIGGANLFGIKDNQNSAYRLAIDSSGNVGIGNNSPSAKLEVQGTSTSSTYTGTGPTGTVIRAQANSGTPWISSELNGATAYFAPENSTTAKFAAYDYATSTEMNIKLGQSRMYIKSDGKVGIGTTNPQMGLHVGSGSQSTAALPGIGIANGSSAYSFFQASDGTKQYIAGVDHNITYTKSGTLSNHDHAIVTNNTNRIYIENTGNVGIGTDAPNSLLHIEGAGGAVQTEASAILQVEATTAGNVAEIFFRAVDTNSGGRNASIGFDAMAGSDNQLYLANGGSKVLTVPSNGRVGIGVTDPKAKFQVEEYGIDTTETSTSATTQTIIHTMSASDFRSARFTIQVTNSTDSTYHTTEILMVHDDTNANITEFGKVYTANEEATFDADVSAGNVRLFATPATTDSMEFKVVCHSITV
jgi:hypothetical protein